MYVNQHDYFITQERVQEDSDIIDSSMYAAFTPLFTVWLLQLTTQLWSLRWQALPDPDALPPKDEPRLSALYADLQHKVSEEASIIQAVFPNPPLVMQVFLQRVFAQVVSSHMSIMSPSFCSHSHMHSSIRSKYTLSSSYLSPPHPLRAWPTLE